MLPGLTNQIDDIAEAGNMGAFQDLPICFQTVGDIICDQCPGAIQIQAVAMERG